MLAITTKSVDSLIAGSFLVLELEVEFSKKVLSPHLLRGQLWLSGKVTNNVVVRFHNEGRSQ